jgi:hypothetical protein
LQAMVKGRESRKSLENNLSWTDESERPSWPGQLEFVGLRTGKEKKYSKTCWGTLSLQLTTTCWEKGATRTVSSAHTGQAQVGRTARLESIMTLKPLDRVHRQSCLSQREKLTLDWVLLWFCLRNLKSQTWMS